MVIQYQELRKVLLLKISPEHGRVLYVAHRWKNLNRWMNNFIKKYILVATLNKCYRLINV